MSDDDKRADEQAAGFAVFGGGSHIRRWGVVCYGVADGVCSVDVQGCGYCRSECRLPKQRAARPS